MADQTAQPATAAGIRAAVLEQLHQAVAARAHFTGDPPQVLSAVEQAGHRLSFGAQIVRDLAEALRAVDAVAIVERQQRGAVPPFDVDSAAVELWNATQEAGAPTSVGDAVVAKLRELAGGAS